jgi:hypothetical protein
MKLIFYPALALAFSIPVHAQSICGTAAEGGTVVMTAPAGSVFTSVTFASYGTPNGSCGSFTIGACNAANSVSIVQTALLGRNSASIDATNGIFGDPCNGTVKRLYIQATYSFVTPLHLLSFSGSAGSTSNLLQWKTVDEINTRSFQVERSGDGAQFSMIGTVAARNRSGENLYAFQDSARMEGSSFYRLKMIDQDGQFTYSRIIKLEHVSNGTLHVYPNPAANYINLSGLPGTGLIEIINMEGRILTQIKATAPMQTISTAAYPAGIYLIKYTGDKEVLYQRMVKQ